MATHEPTADHPAEAAEVKAHAGDPGDKNAKLALDKPQLNQITGVPLEEGLDKNGTTELENGVQTPSGETGDAENPPVTENGSENGPQNENNVHVSENNTVSAETHSVSVEDAGTVPETPPKEEDIGKGEPGAFSESKGPDGVHEAAQTSQETPLPTISTPGSGSVTPSGALLPAPRRTSHTRQALVASISTSTVDNSPVFRKTFETFLTTKEAKKNEQLRLAVQKAVNTLTNSDNREPQVIFDALKVMCEVGSPDTKSKAVDLFAKLFDYSLFDDDSDKVRLTDASVDVVAGCFDGEGTDSELELQVVRALMHSILLMPCHGALLLKAVRQIYNIFIFLLVPRNQSVAQGILTQVIGAIFQRITDLVSRPSRSSFKSPSTEVMMPETPAAAERLTLENLEKLTGENDASRVDDATHATVGDADLVVKDAFLIFRAMCKLLVKPLDADSVDMRLHAVRSKLLSLHIIHTILREHIDVLLNPEVVILSSNSLEQTRLILAVRQYLSLTLSRNAVSPLAPVFELLLEIFWLIISNLRSDFKNEIPVFWDEIYFPLAEMKTSTAHQKRYLLTIVERLCNDLRCIIEFYLNYDCDSAMPNVCEKIINYLTKLLLARVDVTPAQKAAYRENKRVGISVYDVNRIANLTSSALASRPPEPEVYANFPLEYALKMTSLGCLVAFLRSLHLWAQKGLGRSRDIGSRDAPRDRLATVDLTVSTGSNLRNASFVNGSNTALDDGDDPGQFENLKQRKRAFLEGVRQFNQKPKKGISYFVENGFIALDSERDIAVFLLETDVLDKSQVGEYLGDGADRNISIMHAFVDEMDFKTTDFVDALRRFLQAFRLPGEAQKIDRFMLKFAERYVLGNPGVFSSAGTAYVLAYSVILLNTDLHLAQIKNKMAFESFVANNKGIDDGKDLDTVFLQGVYDEIQANEIKLQSEQHAALLAGGLPVPSPGFFGGRDLNREAYLTASKEMSTKTEKLVRDLGRRLRADDTSSVFYAASHVHHVKSIFDTVWMSLLAGLTPPFKEYDEDDVSRTCLEGIKLAVKIACMFELDNARTSFVGALVQFQNLHNYEEMKRKNVDAIHILLDLAVSEGARLGRSWGQVLTSISQLERLQLIAQGVDQDAIPDVSTARVVARGLVDSQPSTGFFGQFMAPLASQTASTRFHNQHLPADVANLLAQTDLEVAIDRVFTNSAHLPGESMVQFVQALAEVLAEEIESLGLSANPRMFLLQKVVDICYYNMSRIRLEWSQLWAILGRTFNEVGCNANLAVVFFALDSLRQLLMRFLDIDELSHFKFQKEFLKPFEHVISHNLSPEVQDMVLECLNNMILARAGHIKLGWKTIFGVLTAAANGLQEALVFKSFKMAKWIYKEYLEEVRAQESFSDLVVCFTALAKNDRFQRVSLLALDVLLRLLTEIAELSFREGQKVQNGETTKEVGAVVGGTDIDVSVEKSSEDAHKRPSEDALVKLWFPVLFGFHDIIMTGSELEVRSRGLSYLFGNLTEYGKYFEESFWRLVARELLFPIFAILDNHWMVINADNADDLTSVWLLTTFIQALRDMVTLLGRYFDPLSGLLDNYLQILISCICQENDTIARIGRSCLHTLLIDNSLRFLELQWGAVSGAFEKLFALTTAQELFDLDPYKGRNFVDDSTYDVGSSVDLDSPVSPRIRGVLGDPEAHMTKAREQSLIVVKCVLQLLMIETLSELFENDGFYEAAPFQRLLELARLLEGSYTFARNFNDDYDLRVRLWNAGVIERLPNLLKQELSSLAVFLNIMFRMYCDDDKTKASDKTAIVGSIVPTCSTITERYADFDETNQHRNIQTWKPVIVEIFQGYVELDEDDFAAHSPAMYSLTLRLFAKSMSTDLRMAVKTFLARVGDTFVKT